MCVDDGPTGKVVVVSKRMWYSGSCRRVCIIEGEGLVENERSVYVFRAGDRGDATRRLLELAQGQDKVYENVEGKRVRWALVSIDTLDDLGDGSMHEIEVHSSVSRVQPPDPSMSLETTFTPEKFEPGRSGVTGW
jgi:hypothetical protein